MIEIEQKYIRVSTPLYVMEDFYDDVLNRINKTIYEHDKLYGPKDFFSQVFKIDIKIDYRKDILKKLLPLLMNQLMKKMNTCLKQKTMIPLQK